MGIAEHLGGNTPGLELLYGTVSSIDPNAGTITVNVGGTSYTALLVADAGFQPGQGDGVALLRQGQTLLVVGALSAYLPTHGVVASTGASTLGVTVAGHGTISLPFLASYATPTVNDVVAIMWSGSPSTGVVLGELSTSPTSPTLPAPAPPPPPPPATGGITTFPALSVGTYRSGWRTDDNGDVIQGTAPVFSGLNEGAWFYHGTIRNTLGGATVDGAEIFLGRTSGGDFAARACHLYRVTNDTRPGGALTFGSGPHDVSLPVNSSGWFGFSTSIAQELVNSGGSVGIKAPSGPYMRMYGLSKSGSAGALRIYWRR